MKRQAPIGIIFSLVFTFVNTSAMSTVVPKDKTVRLLDITSKLPPEILQSRVFSNQLFKNFSAIDYLNYYNALNDIRKEAIANLYTPQENKDLVEEVIDSKIGIPFKRFKGDTLMENLQSIAQSKLAKKLNCTTESLNDGSCQPLINSSDPAIPIKDRVRKPFKEITEPWTKDWIKILPQYETLEHALDKENRPTLPVTFLRRISNNNFDQNLPNAFINAATPVAREKGFKLAPFNIVSNKRGIHIDSQKQSGKEAAQSPYISLIRPKVSNEMSNFLTITFLRNSNIEYMLNLEYFPEAVQINQPVSFKNESDEEIVLDIIKTFSKNIGAHSLEISLPIDCLSEERQVFYLKHGFKNQDDYFVLDLYL